MSDSNKPPVPPRVPKNAVVKRKRGTELLSASEWALRKLEEKYGKGDNGEKDSNDAK